MRYRTRAVDTVVTTDTRVYPGDYFRRTIAPTKADTSNRAGRANGAASSVFSKFSDSQLRPISTAMRIRSEWFLAPSFCFSIDVMLVTVL